MDYDYFVIGAGSGGVSSARRAASYGAKVAICEESRTGGTCVIRGCVPKKLLSYAAHYADDVEDALGYGWHFPQAPQFDWPTLIANKDSEINRLQGIYEGMLAKAGVERLEGRGILVAPHTVRVGKRTLTAQHILIATGARPYRPDWQGVEHTITSNEVFDLAVLPRKAVIIGAGYIAVEFAGILKALGSEVHLVIRYDSVLRGFDDEVSAFLTQALQDKGIILHQHTLIERFSKEGDAVNLHKADGSIITADCVINATGRVANTGNLGLDTVGVQVNPKDDAIIIDKALCTTAAGIYAVGDVVNQINLTPFAITQGRALAEHLFNGKPIYVDADDVPSAVFSNPPIGTVGLTEAQAREKYGDVKVYKTSFRPMKYTLAGRQEKVFMKLVVEAKSTRVVGCHMVGMDAPEIIQGFAVAIKAGATKAHFDATVGIHPTSAEEFVTMA